MRRAAPGDLERVAAIEAACFPAAEACSAQTFAERLRCFADHFRICEVEGDAVGFVDGAVINARTIDDALYADASRHDPAGAWQAV